MEKIKEIKNKLNKLLDKIEDKETIKEIASIDKDIDEIESEHNSLVEENKGLIKDYKDLYKASAFKTDKVDKGIEEPKTFTFGEFLDDYLKEGDKK